MKNWMWIAIGIGIFFFIQKNKKQSTISDYSGNQISPAPGFAPMYDPNFVS